MEFRRFENTYVIRLDRGEEIVQSLTRLVEDEGIRLAEVRALGAVNDFTVGLYHVEQKEYQKNHFQIEAEITNLWGLINTMHGAPYLHLHMTVGDEHGHAFGGHLNEAFIGATCEMLVTVIDGSVDRRVDEGLGLNVLDFQD